MKLQHYAIVFLIIILPFSVMCRSKMTNYSLMLKDQVRLNNVIDSATQDSLDMLVELNDEFQMMYSNQRFNITQTLAKESVKSFFRTMAINFNMPYIDGNTESYFSMYVPAIVIIGYDGFFIYSVDESPTGYAYQMSNKIPYAYHDEESGTIVHFTLGNYITLYTNDMIYEGEITSDFSDDAFTKYQEFATAFSGMNSAEILQYITDITQDMSIIVEALIQASPSPTERLCPAFLIPGDEAAGAIPLTRDYGRNDEQPSEFHRIRRETIINLIQETLQEEINEHNTYAKMFGSTYNFQLPEIVNDEWTNSINDISVMSFIQGMPIGTNEYYNNYALSGSRIIQTEYYYGTRVIDAAGIEKTYYHSYDCPLIADFHTGVDDCDVDNIFITREQAAQNGYYPCATCRP